MKCLILLFVVLFCLPARGYGSDYELLGWYPNVWEFGGDISRRTTQAEEDFASVHVVYDHYMDQYQSDNPYCDPRNWLDEIKQVRSNIVEAHGSWVNGDLELCTFASASGRDECWDDMANNYNMAYFYRLLDPPRIVIRGSGIREYFQRPASEDAVLILGSCHQGRSDHRNNWFSGINNYSSSGACLAGYEGTIDPQYMLANNDFLLKSLSCKKFVNIPAYGNDVQDGVRGTTAMFLWGHQRNSVAPIDCWIWDCVFYEVGLWSNFIYYARSGGNSTMHVLGKWDMQSEPDTLLSFRDEGVNPHATWYRTVPLYTWRPFLAVYQVPDNGRPATLSPWFQEGGQPNQWDKYSVEAETVPDLPVPQAPIEWLYPEGGGLRSGVGWDVIIVGTGEFAFEYSTTMWQHLWGHTNEEGYLLNVCAFLGGDVQSINNLVKDIHQVNIEANNNPDGRQFPVWAEGDPPSPGPVIILVGDTIPRHVYPDSSIGGDCWRENCYSYNEMGKLTDESRINECPVMVVLKEDLEALNRGITTAVEWNVHQHCHPGVLLIGGNHTTTGGEYMPLTLDMQSLRNKYLQNYINPTMLLDSEIPSAYRFQAGVDAVNQGVELLHIQGLTTWVRAWTEFITASMVPYLSLHNRFVVDATTCETLATFLGDGWGTPLYRSIMDNYEGSTAVGVWGLTTAGRGESSLASLLFAEELSKVDSSTPLIVPCWLAQHRLEQAGFGEYARRTTLFANGWIRSPALNNLPSAVQSEAAPVLQLSAAPNPFSAQTTISFGIPSKCHVNLGVYDVSGRLVERLVDREFNSGQYHIVWNGNNSGVYFIRVQAGEQVFTKKIQLIR